jgi:hypothetical protein
VIVQRGIERIVRVSIPETVGIRVRDPAQSRRGAILGCIETLTRNRVITGGLFDEHAKQTRR